MKLKSYDAFRSNNFVMNVSGSTKRIAITHPSMDVTIIGNFDVVPLTINPSFSRTGKWYDYLGGDSTNVVNTQGLLLLQPGEFHIYTTMKLPTPDLGTMNAVTVPPSDYALFQNYPNPFNLSTTIRYELPVESSVKVRIFNLLGEEIATLVDAKDPAGVHEVRWNGAGPAGIACSSGIYFVRIEAGNFKDTKRMLLLK
jgi:hypothetical protein